MKIQVVSNKMPYPRRFCTPWIWKFKFPRNISN